MFWIWDALLFIAPAYVANSIPVVAGGGKPIDGGKTWNDGRPVLGKGKTIRGAVAAVISAIIVGGILGYFIPLGAVSSSLSWLVGLVLGVGTVLGDTAGSFIKRRLGIKRGEMLALIDQDGFILVSLALAHPLVPLPLPYWIAILAITPFIHVGFNVIAYLAHWKDVPY